MGQKATVISNSPQKVEPILGFSCWKIGVYLLYSQLAILAKIANSGREPYQERGRNERIEDQLYDAG